MEKQKLLESVRHEEMELIADSANAVWQEIGDDILGMEGGSIPRSDVIEVVVDAGRLEDRLKKDGIGKSIIDKWLSLSYEEKEKLLTKHAFKYERYGW